MMKSRMTFSDAFKLAAAFAVTGVALMLMLNIGDILLTFLAAVIFAIILDKPIDSLVRHKVPRTVAAVFMYLVFLATLTLVLYLILPPLAQEIRSFAASFPSYLERLSPYTDGGLPFDPQLLEFSQYIRTLSDITLAGSRTIVGTIFDLFGGFISFLIIFFVALFMNMQKDGVRHLVFLFAPPKRVAYASELFDKTQNLVSGWFWGKAISSLLVGLTIFVGLFLLGTPYAITLAVLAALLNFIQFVGPTIAAVPAVLLGFLQSPLHGLGVLTLYFVTNNIIESFIFVPLLMKRMIQMNPALLIFFILIGGRLGGILGIVISVPVAAIVSLLIREYQNGSLNKKPA